MRAKKKQFTGVKYAAKGVEEFQPGSRGKVVRNKLGITRVREMEDAELAGYIRAERALVERFTSNHRFTARDIHTIHKFFLGKIYHWAGHYRNVNMSKGGFVFASAMAIPPVMKEFEQRVLAKNTPCRGTSFEEIARNIATVHVEFLLIHPYREGNGRTARLLATLMAYQAGLPGLDFGFIGSRGKEFQAYVTAIHAGVRKDYKPMQAIMLRAIKRALRRVK